MPKQKSNNDVLEKIVVDARRNQDEREKGYREQALKLYPWICGRCQREFTRANLAELTVHHRDHDHDNNPSNGGNWELLCLFFFFYEHKRYLENAGTSSTATENSTTTATHNPFADLKDLLNKDD